MKSRNLPILLLALSLIYPSLLCAETLTFPDLVNRLMDLERLAVLPETGEECAQFSSYDRTSTVTAAGTYRNWDANADGNGNGMIPMENGKYVVGEVAGPGCIWRIWSAAPGGGRVRIYLDGSSSPAVDLTFANYFRGSASPFNYPALVYKTPGGYGSPGGANNFVPIPFNQSCKILADTNFGMYYHFTYSKFPAGTVVPTFTRSLDSQGRAALQKVNDFFTSGLGTDPAGIRIGQQILSKVFQIPGDGRATEIASLSGGPRAITTLRIGMPGIGAMDRAEQMRVLRELVVRIFWDGETSPSVWCPLGDFFGTGPGYNPYRSLPLGMADDTFYSYWYMPFADGARIEVVNDGASTRSLSLYLVHAPVTHPVENLGRFHAKWHRDAFPPPKGIGRDIDWTMLTTQGRGRFCGTILNIWNPRGNWWGEGDEKFFVDGEKFPSTFGTGSEDYFGYAWCLPILFARAFHAQTLTYPDNRFHISVNRWQIAENVPFQQSFEGSIERIHWFLTGPVLYSSVAYWYLAPGGTDPYPAVPPSDRMDYYTMPSVHRVPRVIEAEDLPVVQITSGYAHFQDLSWWNRKGWSGDAQVQWTNAGVGSRLGLEFPVDKTDTYTVKVAMAKAADYGIAQIYLDGQKAGAPIDLYVSNWVVPTGEIDLGKFALTAGNHTLTMEITGANPSSKGRIIGLDYIKLYPPSGVMDWLKFWGED